MKYIRYSLICLKLIAASSLLLSSKVIAQPSPLCESLGIFVREAPTGFRAIRGKLLDNIEKQWECKNVPFAQCLIADQLGLQRTVHTPIFVQVTDAAMDRTKLLGALEACSLKIVDYKNGKYVEIKNVSQLLRTQLKAGESFSFELKGLTDDYRLDVGIYWTRNEKGFLLRAGLSE